jgi:hypothetical protein
MSQVCTRPLNIEILHWVNSENVTHGHIQQCGVIRILNVFIQFLRFFKQPWKLGEFGYDMNYVSCLKQNALNPSRNGPWHQLHVLADLCRKLQMWYLLHPLGHLCHKAFCGVSFLQDCEVAITGCWSSCRTIIVTDRAQKKTHKHGPLHPCPGSSSGCPLWH